MLCSNKALIFFPPFLKRVHLTRVKNFQIFLGSLHTPILDLTFHQVWALVNILIVILVIFYSDIEKRKIAKSSFTMNSPTYIMYEDAELVAQANGVLSKELKDRLIRNTCTSMIAISHNFKANRRPLKEEVSEMAKCICINYPTLRVNNSTVS